MNKVYRNIWNAISGTWVAAAETAKGHSKGSTGGKAGIAALTLVAGVAAVGVPGYVSGAETGFAVTDGTGAVINGQNCAEIIYGANGVAVGCGTQIGNSTTDRAGLGVALGYLAKVTADNAVAIGANSVAERANTVSVGSDGYERQITHVAAGANGTDAVNVSQLNGVRDLANKGWYVSANGGAGQNVAPGGTVNFGAGDANTKVSLDGNTVTYSVVSNPTFAGMVTANGGLSVGGGQIVNMGGNRVSGIAAGEDGTDAVNKSQLDATNQQVTQNTTNISNLQTNVTDIKNGTDGLVQQDPSSGGITVAKARGGATVDFTGTAGARKLTGVAEGELSADSQDAVNGSQLYSLNSAINNINAGGGSKYFRANSSLADAQASGANSVAVGGAANASGAGAIALGSNSTASANNSVALGAGSKADRDNSVSVGAAGSERQITNVAAGTADTDAVNVSQLKNAGLVNGDGTANTAVTYDTKSDGSTDYGNVSLGNGAAGGTAIHNVAAGSSGTDAVNVDQLNSAVSALNNSVATAAHPMFTADGNRQTEAAAANGTRSTAMGANAVAHADNSVALGAGSVAHRENTVSVGAAGNERQVTNVAAGTQGTDAVNVNQMNASSAQSRQYTDQQIGGVRGAINEVGRNAYSGVAAATALSMIPDVDLGKTIAVGVGTATYKGYQAAAVGATARIRQNVKVRVGAGTSSGGTTVGVGASYQW